MRAQLPQAMDQLRIDIKSTGESLQVWPMTELWENGHSRAAGRPVPRCHFGTFANWYTLVVSKARQASLILEEVHSVRMIVGASLRARQ